MDHIEYDFQLVDTQIRRLEETSVRLHQMIREQYEECMLEVRNAWDSESGRLYYQKMQQQQEKLYKLLHEIEHIQESLRESSILARSIEKKAEEIAR